MDRLCFNLKHSIALDSKKWEDSANKIDINAKCPFCKNDYTEQVQMRNKIDKLFIHTRICDYLVLHENEIQYL